MIGNFRMAKAALVAQSATWVDEVTAKARRRDISIDRAILPSTLRSRIRAELAALSLGCFLCVFAGSAAFAQTTDYQPDQVEYQKPSVRLVEAPLVPISTMQTYFQSKLNGCGGTCRTNFTDEEPAVLLPIKELALALSRNGEVTGVEYNKRVFEYVRNNIHTEFRFGLAKGALGALLDKSGTAFDQVSLMSALLQARGVTGIDVKVGTITLTGTAATSRFGTSDARILCRVLADGGIAAEGPSLNSGCSGSGNVTTLTMAHAWLVVGGNAYDPAQKPLLIDTAADFSTRMGCAANCGTAIAQNVPAPTTGAVPSITAVNESLLKAPLQNYASVALDSVRASHPDGTIWSVIGRERIETQEYVAGSETPPNGNVMFSAPNDFQDPFRTTISIGLSGLTKSLFGDAIYGRRVAIRTSLGKRTAGATQVGTKIVMDKANPSLPLAEVLVSTSASNVDFALQMGIAHPYPLATHPANETFTQNALPRAPVSTFTDPVAWPDLSIIYGAGATAPLAIEQNSRLANLLGEAGHSAASTGIQFLVQESRLFLLARRLQNVAGVKHHSLGYIATAAQGVPINTTVSISSAFSAIERTGGASKRSAFAGAFAAISSMAEGSVTQQAEDAWEAGSGVSLVSRVNEKSIPFYFVNSANIGSALSALSGYSSEQLASLQSYAGQGYDMIVPRDGKLGNFNFTKVCGIAAPCGTQAISLPYGSVLAYKQMAGAYLVGGRFKGAGAPGRGFDPIEGARSAAKQTSIALMHQIRPAVSLGTGGMTLSPPPDVIAGWPDSPGALTFQRSFSSDNTSSLNCRMVLEPVRVLGAPVGSAPIIVLTERCGYMGPDSSMNGHIGGGWTHNHQMAAELVNNAMPMLGDHSAMAATPTLAALQVMLQLHETPNFRNILTSAFVAKWLGDRFINNVVSLNVGGSNMQFVLGADGKWLPPLGGSARLTVSGSRTGPAIAVGAVRFDYRGVAVTYISGEGNQVSFDQPNKALPSTFDSVAGPATAIVIPRFSARQIVSSGNIATEYTYANIRNGFIQTEDKILTKAMSSLGNVLQFRYWPQTAFMQNQNALPAAEHYMLQNVWNDANNNNVVDSNESLSELVRPNTSSYLSNPDYALGSTYLTVRKSDGDSASTNDPKIRYYYMDLGDCSEPTEVGATLRILSKMMPKRICTGGATTTSRITANQDGLYRNISVTDARGNASKTFVGGLGGEQLFRSESVGPAANGIVTRETAYFNERGDLVKSVNGLGHPTIIHYDDAHRPIRTILPEGNAIEYAYDVRGNKTRECAIPKGAVDWSSLTPLNERTPMCNTSRTPIADLATTTTYAEGSSVRADQCVNMKTCNKPISVKDPKGNQTDYEWSAVHGQLTKETKPADSNGNRPVNEFIYSPFTGVNGGTFYLLTSKVEAISPGVTTMTNYEYDPTNKFVLKSSVVDSGGISLRTCYKFDAVGNLISKTDPKSGLTVCP